MTSAVIFTVFFQAVKVLKIDEDAGQPRFLYFLQHGFFRHQHRVGAGGKQLFALDGFAVGEYRHVLDARVNFAVPRVVVDAGGGADEFVRTAQKQHDLVVGVPEVGDALDFVGDGDGVALDVLHVAGKRLRLDGNERGNCQRGEGFFEGVVHGWLRG